MGDLEKIHDEALEHEIWIMEYTEKISNLRVKMYEKKR